MDIGSAITTLFSKDGVSLGLLAFIAWFIVAKLWPFVTEQWWPNVVQRAKDQTTILSNLSAAVVALKLLSEQLIVRLEEHSTLLNDIKTTLHGHPTKDKGDQP